MRAAHERSRKAMIAAHQRSRKAMIAAHQRSAAAWNRYQKKEPTCP
jgi:hypothetical protein